MTDAFVRIMHWYYYYSTHKYIYVNIIWVTLYGEMCVSDGKASMPITCRTSSNCPPSAWLKCFLACLPHTQTHRQTHTHTHTHTHTQTRKVSDNLKIYSWNVLPTIVWNKIKWDESETTICVIALGMYRTASMRLFCLMSSMNSWILRLNSRQLCQWERQKMMLYSHQNPNG